MILKNGKGLKIRIREKKIENNLILTFKFLIIENLKLSLNSVYIWKLIKRSVIWKEIPKIVYK